MGHHSFAQQSQLATWLLSYKSPWLVLNYDKIATSILDWTSMKIDGWHIAPSDRFPKSACQQVLVSQLLAVSISWLNFLNFLNFNMVNFDLLLLIHHMMKMLQADTYLDYHPSYQWRIPSSYFLLYLLVFTPYFPLFTNI